MQSKNIFSKCPQYSKDSVEHEHESEGNSRRNHMNSQIAGQIVCQLLALTKHCLKHSEYTPSVMWFHRLKFVKCQWVFFLLFFFPSLPQMMQMTSYTTNRDLCIGFREWNQIRWNIIISQRVPEFSSTWWHTKRTIQRLKRKPKIRIRRKSTVLIQHWPAV